MADNADGPSREQVLAAVQAALRLRRRRAASGGIGRLTRQEQRMISRAVSGRPARPSPPPGDPRQG